MEIIKISFPPFNIHVATGPYLQVQAVISPLYKGATAG